MKLSGGSLSPSTLHYDTLKKQAPGLYADLSIFQNVAIRVLARETGDFSTEVLVQEL